MAGKMVYEWGKRGFSISPQVVGAEVERVVRRNGLCQATDLVKAARLETSPLHPLFTWEDSKAANEWRKHEARKVLGALVVTIRHDGHDVKAPAFLSVGHTLRNRDAGEGYRPISVITADHDLNEEALNEALARLRSLQQRYAALDALSGVWDAVDRIAV